VKLELIITNRKCRLQLSNQHSHDSRDSINKVCCSLQFFRSFAQLVRRHKLSQQLAEAQSTLVAQFCV
jgi:hypothetical protein